MSGKRILLAVLAGLAMGMIIQYASSGHFFGWWIVVPIPVVILGELFWGRERQRREPR